jgi:hypothetical protein
MASLGTKKHPAVVRVATVEQAEEIMTFCQARGWQAIVGVEAHPRQQEGDDWAFPNTESQSQRSLPLRQRPEVQEMLRCIVGTKKPHGQGCCAAL